MPLYVEARPDNGVWYIRGTFQGVPVRRSADTKDKATAEAVRSLVEKEILARILDPSKPAQRDRLSFADACDEYLTKGQGASAGPAQKRIVERLRDHPPLGARAIETIDQIAVDEAVSALVGDDAAPATKIRAVIGPVATVLRHHAARGRCARPAFAKPQVPVSRTPFLEPRQALALIAAAAAHLKPLLVFLFGTGARLGEALGLDWEQVDLQAARARLIDTKNGADRLAALPQAVVWHWPACRTARARCSAATTARPTPIARAKAAARSRPDGKPPAAGPGWSFPHSTRTARPPSTRTAIASCWRASSRTTRATRGRHGSTP